MFIPALVALAAIVARHASRRPAATARRDAASDALLALPLVLSRLSRRRQRSCGRCSWRTSTPATCTRSCVLSAALALAAGASWPCWPWRRRRGWLVDAAPAAARSSLRRWSLVGWNLVAVRRLGARRGRTRTTRPRSRSARLLPPGTLVQGKLANGLALENRIRPIFIGHGFGNYDDRLQRDDVRYILTYDFAELGYESQADPGSFRTSSIAIRSIASSRRSTSTKRRRPRSRRAHRQAAE